MKLDAPYGSTIAELKASFRRLVKLCHPDKCSDKTWATREFREIIDDFNKRINAQEKPLKTVHYKESVFKITKSAAFGYSAEYKKGIVTVILDVPKNVDLITVVLMQSPGHQVALKVLQDRHYYRFTFAPPKGFSDGTTLAMTNLPFQCKVTLKYDK